MCLKPANSEMEHGIQKKLKFHEKIHVQRKLEKTQNNTAMDLITLLYKKKYTVFHFKTYCFFAHSDRRAERGVKSRPVNIFCVHIRDILTILMQYKKIYFTYFIYFY